jgi:anti-sigma factor RsiW
MNCKAIERLILDGEERPLADGERQRVEEHLRDCPGCRAFEAGRRVIREGLEEFRREGLPRSLELRTRNLCRDALGAGASADGARTKVPVAVTVVSLLFTVLAVIWLTVALVDVTPGQPLPSSAWAAIVFIAQNALMLFLSPVILRPARTSER